MCGIVGGVEPGGLDPTALQVALQALRHRGPDGEGTYREGDVALAMRRLAIIDVPGGDQPIWNEERSVATVMNGEVYDYRELTRELEQRGHRFSTRSDTEVLVHLYEEHGPELCRRLRGMFAFAVWDAERRLLLLGRDRLGKKPLFWARTPRGGLVFASELKALRPLLRACGGELRVRAQSVYDYLSLAAVPQPATIYEGVQALEPGSWLTFEGGAVSQRLYWSLDYQPKRRLGWEGTLRETRRVVEESVRLRLRSDVPVGAFLSAGVDSTVITYEAARALGGDLDTFTVQVDDPELDESPVAVRTARALGVRHTVLPLRVAPLETVLRLARTYDQPFADSSAIPSLAVAELAAQHVKVILTGDGGDELFAGYRRYLAAAAEGLLAPAMSRLGGGRLGAAMHRVTTHLQGRLGDRRRGTMAWATRFLRTSGRSPGERYLLRVTDMLLDGDKRPVWRQAPMRATEDWVAERIPPGLRGLDEQLAGDVRVNLVNDQLVKVDVATMAASLEARCPLLDHNIAELTALTPGRYLLRGGRPKAVLRAAYRGLIPEEVVWGKKRGFEIPMASWLQGDLRPLVGDTLGSQPLVGDYLEPSFVTDLLERRVLRDRNWAYLVYALLILELWLREEAV
jgi:asparagine synthase (glutamine-hydrolysing)